MVLTPQAAPRRATRVSRAWLAWMVLLLPALLGAGCSIRGLKRAAVAPGSVAGLSREKTMLKAHLHDGGVVVFGSWSFDPSTRTVSGTGHRLDLDRHEVSGAAIAVSLDSVALFESDATRVPGPMVPITVLTMLHGLVSAVCLTAPKACFGSCPTFYAWDGEKQSLMAEGFSASVAPALEGTDLDALDRVRVEGRTLTLSMTNEALETHVVRRADILCVPRGPGERVLADPEGALWTTRDWSPPAEALASEGDCRARLAARDLDERTSLADSTDLAARETVELTFAPAGPGPRGVAIVARQSLLSTYVFYQTLAWMGRSAGTWLASLEQRDAATRSRTAGPARLLGNIEVQVERDGAWTTVGEFHETGPLAWDSRVVPLPEPPRAGGAPHVRLRMSRGLWRVDQVALVSLWGRTDAERVRPSRVLRHGRDDTRALASLLGEGAPLVTQPGDTLAIVYALPREAERSELFLESRGYYLEWVREAWIAEENPERLMRLFLDPAGSLRRMAPEFKRVEPGMERSFWGSRYAR